MANKQIDQNYKLAMTLPKRSSSLSKVNALTDQALMNLTYETMSETDYQDSVTKVTRMMNLYREIKKA